MPYFTRLSAAQIDTKSGPNDLVTAADLACERFLSERLLKMRPGSMVLGEEGVAEDPGKLDLLASDDEVWIVDPIDGTYNFTKGSNTFAILLALARRGEVLAGWIHFPVSGSTLWALRGEGAYRDHGPRLKVAAPDRIDRMTAAFYVGRRRAPALADRINEVRHRLGPLRFARCVAQEYAELAQGEMHYALFTRQLPWDHAAGSLIHVEAGGVQAFLDDEPYLLRERAVPYLAAPDRESWERIRALIAPR